MTISVTALATKAALVTTSAPSATLIFVDPSFRHSVHVAADAPAEHVGECLEPGTVLDAPPHHQSQAAARPRDAIHLTQRSPAIGEKLQPELTVHDVKRTVRERHRHGTGFPPCYGRAGGRLAGDTGGGDGEHAAIQVEADDRARSTHALRSESGDNAGAAGNIQDALAGSRVGQRHHQRRPGREDSGNQRALVDLSGISGHLPLSLVAHEPPPATWVVS